METRKVLKVLIIYQYGDRVAGSAQERFVIETQEKLNGATVQNFSIIAERLSKAGDPDASSTIYTNFVSAVEDYDYAVALFTHDERKASEAGNLWFEVGFWYAARSGGLLIIQHLTGDRKLDEKMDVPSNLKGVICTQATSAAEVLEAFNTFLGKVRDPSSPRRVLENFKEKINLGKWIEKECEEIKIIPDENLVQEHELFRGLETFRCENKVERVINESPSELSFLLQVGSYGIPDFTYRVVFGTGLMGTKEQARVNNYILNVLPGSPTGIKDIFEISDLQVSADGKQAKIACREPEKRLNGRCFVFACEWDNDVSGPFTVSFRIKSIFLAKQGWYRYLTHVSVRRLTVSLEAPYRLATFPNVWPRQEDKGDEYPIGDRYYSQVVLSEPVFAGSDIRWVLYPLEDKPD